MNYIIESYLQKPYARIVIPVEEGGYHAEILEFPGCYAQGQSVEEAYESLEEAAKLWIVATIEKGQTVPEPSSSLTFSGNVLLRMPRSIHRQAVKMAERNRTSLNTYLVSAVSARVGAEEFYNVIAQRLERHFETLTRDVFRVWNEYLTERTTTRFENKSIAKLERTVTTSADLGMANVGGQLNG